MANLLEVAPTEIFDEAAAYASTATADLFRGFGRQTDVTPESWRITVIDTPEGLRIV